MASPNNTTTEALDTMKSAWAAFAAGPLVKSQNRHFWQAEGQFLKEVEKYSAAWLKRRHTGTIAAIEASRQLAEGSMRDPAAAMKVIADWQSHAMERLVEDATGLSEMITRCTGTLISNEAEVIEETAEATKRAMKTSKSSPV
jgi:hypothetical protein